METIGQQQIFGYGQNEPAARPTKCTQIRKAPGRIVASYMELATRIAELQFLNRDFVLLFRGQSDDYKNRQRNTSLKPSIMRPLDGRLPDRDDLRQRYDLLVEAEAALVAEYEAERLPGVDRLRRQQILRWSILQHYEVCGTPLLDVTHSLRIAASFASDDAGGEAFLFVLAVPHISGAITASAEAGLQIVRLASVCPPSALRPHIQEGYLLGEYPDLSSTDQKKLYGHYEIDFGRRLIAKFRFDPGGFWERRIFPRVPHDALYPSPSDDPLCALAGRVKRRMGA